jgi:soluble lytic murein transglycosylase-like protein
VKQTINIFAALFLVIFIFPSRSEGITATSDYMKITLKNGGTFYGKVSEEPNGQVMVETADAIMISFTRQEIASIVSAGTTVNPQKNKAKSGHLSQDYTYLYAAGNSVNEFIRALAKKYKMDPDLIKAIIKTESDFDRFAVSCKGAKGLMQLMPQTAQECDVFDIYNPYQNIEGGTKYLRSQLNEFNGDIRLALAAYNAGPENVKKYNGVPPFGETRRYIEKVLRFYNYFKKGGTDIIHKKSLYTFKDKRGTLIITDIPSGE